MNIAVITAQFLEEYVRYALKKLRQVPVPSGSIDYFSGRNSAKIKRLPQAGALAYQKSLLEFSPVAKKLNFTKSRGVYLTVCL